jgi:hypothetical protein
MIDFPASPTVGQNFSAAGVTWTWDGAKWTATGLNNAYLPLTGGTMSGPVTNLTLAADPTAALGGATKQYVDAGDAALGSNIRYRNRIINGDMAIDQRNGGAQIAMGAVSAYVIDRWKIGNSGVASKGSVGRVTLAAPPGNAPVGFPFLYCLSFNTATAYASPAAGDAVSWQHLIEGYNFLDAQWGTPNALPITVEFWASSPVAGAYAFSLCNTGGARSYVSTFVLPANTWTKIRLDIPADTAGTWSVAASAACALLRFGLCIGSTYQTATVNAWQNGNFLSTAGAVNVLATTSSGLSITGVALMVNSPPNAEPDFRKQSDNLLDCLRYYQKGQLYGGSAAYVSGFAAIASSLCPVLMRATATMAQVGGVSTNVGTITLQHSGTMFYGSAVVAATGTYALNAIFTADADL